MITASANARRLSFICEKKGEYLQYKTGYQGGSSATSVLIVAAINVHARKARPG
jgi:hypothetical protein